MMDAMSNVQGWYVEAHKNAPRLHNVTMKVYAVTKGGLRQRQVQTFLDRDEALAWFEEFKARHPGEPITTATLG